MFPTIYDTTMRPREVDTVLSPSAKMDAAHLRPSCSDFSSEDVRTEISALFSRRRPSPGFVALLAPAATDDRRVCGKRWDSPAGRASSAFICARRVAGVATQVAVRSGGTLAVSTIDQFFEIKMPS